MALTSSHRATTRSGDTPGTPPGLAVPGARASPPGRVRALPVHSRGADKPRLFFTHILPYFFLYLIFFLEAKRVNHMMGIQKENRNLTVESRGRHLVNQLIRVRISSIGTINITHLPVMNLICVAFC